MTDNEMWVRSLLKKIKKQKRWGIIKIDKGKIDLFQGPHSWGKDEMFWKVNSY